MQFTFNTLEAGASTVLKSATALLIGAALIFSAPVAYADRDDGKYHHQNQQHKQNDKRWHRIDRHGDRKQTYKQRDDKPRFTQHHQEKPRFTRHNEKPQKQKHHKPRKHHVSGHHGNKHNIKKHHGNQRHLIRDHYRDHSPHDSWFFSISSGVPVYEAPVYKTHYKKTVWQRIENQQRRIRQGVKSGELTRHEAKVLREDLRRIRHRVNSYKHDGRLNHYERRHLNRMLDELSDRIYRKKHNPRTRHSDDDYHYYH